jgi:hypothetical protein
MTSRRGALSGASLLSTAWVGYEAYGQPTGGAARASRRKSKISCIQGKFVCFDLDPSSLSLRRVKAQGLRGNTQTFLSCRRSFGRKPSLRPNQPRLEARLDTGSIRTTNRILKRLRCSRLHRFFLSYCPSTSPSASDAVSRLSAAPRHIAEAHFGFGLFRSRNAKWLAANRVTRFTGRMRNGDIAGSKLSASLTRPHSGRLIAPCVGQLGKGGGPPLHPPCRFARHAETVPVSTPFGLCRIDTPSWVREVRS